MMTEIEKMLFDWYNKVKEVERDDPQEGWYPISIEVASPTDAILRISYKGK